MIPCSGFPLSRGNWFHADERILLRNFRPQAKGASAFRCHRQLHLLVFTCPTNNLEVEPLAKSRIMNLRPSLPELRRQAALNLQMVQLQLNHANSLGKITAHIPRADLQPGDFATSELCLDYHRSPRISE